MLLICKCSWYNLHVCLDTGSEWGSSCGSGKTKGGCTLVSILPSWLYPMYWKLCIISKLWLIFMNLDLRYSMCFKNFYQKWRRKCVSRLQNFLYLEIYFISNWAAIIINRFCSALNWTTLQWFSKYDSSTTSISITCNLLERCRL